MGGAAASLTVGCKEEEIESMEVERVEMEEEIDEEQHTRKEWKDEERRNGEPASER